MSWRRVRAKGGPPLKPFPKWNSLKLGDVVVMSPTRALLLVKEFRQKHVWPNSRTHYSRKGMFLDVATAETLWLDLDDVGVRGEVIRGGRGA